MFFSTVAASVLALASTAAAVPSEYNPFSTRSNCKNTARTRDCWGNGWDIYCDYDKQHPATGQVKKFDLHLTSGLGGVAGSKAPLDGHQRQMLLVNGQYPGPKIEANWGDTVQITVHNDLDPAVWDNGTSFHWHGLRQYLTNTQDGTNGITECPIAPGQSRTYTWVANAYGTSWYHSHYSIQYADGAVGPIVIHGPASANYDIELGPILLTDWFYEEAFDLYDAAKVAPGPPTSDTVLVNGMMTSAEGGAYYTTTLTPGKKHLVRFVNTGINDWFHVALEGHQFQVIAADFVPVKPFFTNELVLGVGQRYDVIIEANNTVGNYWLSIGTGNAGDPRGCDGPNAAEGTVKAIFHYKGAPTANPTGNGTTLTTGCEDLPGPLVPIVKTNVPSGTPNHDFEVGFIPANTSVAGQFVTWTVDSTMMEIDWETPTLSYVEKKTPSSGYPVSDHVYEINVKPNAWTYWVIQQAATNPPIPHPIHLHGHDFWILAQGAGAWDGNFTTLKNPTRRDTATLPATGHLVLAFPADNPGAWLMHCHIPFHISGGLGLQFLERKADILKSVKGLSGFDQGCSAWATYQAGGSAVVQDDSGL